MKLILIVAWGVIVTLFVGITAGCSTPIETKHTPLPLKKTYRARYMDTYNSSYCPAFHGHSHIMPK